MNRTDALESIREIWGNEDLSLGEKIIHISEEFSASGLDVETTAAYIHTTESELSALLALGELDDELIELISKVNPPKTTWTILSSASDEEIRHALEVFDVYQHKNETTVDMADTYVYQAMIEVSGPTVEQKVANLTGDEIKHALKKGEDFNAINDKEARFLKGVAAQKKMGKVLSEKQIAWLISILNKMIEKNAITHESIDGDQDICDKILDAVGK